MTDQALKAAVERVTADVERIASFSPNIATVYSEPEKRYINDLAADLRTLLAALSFQAEALRPFAEAVESLDDDHADGSPIWESPAAMGIDAGHLRTALSQYRTLGDRHDD